MCPDTMVENHWYKLLAQCKVFNVILRAYHGCPLIPVAKNCPIIAISFYRNIVCKNVVCEADEQVCSLLCQPDSL